MSWPTAAVVMTTIIGIIGAIVGLLKKKDRDDSTTELKISIAEIKRDVDNLKEIINRFKDDVEGDIHGVETKIDTLSTAIMQKK